MATTPSFLQHYEGLCTHIHRIQSLPKETLEETLVNETKRCFLASTIYIIQIRDSFLNFVSMIPTPP